MATHLCWMFHVKHFFLLHYEFLVYLHPICNHTTLTQHSHNDHTTTTLFTNKNIKLWEKFLEFKGTSRAVSAIPSSPCVMENKSVASTIQ